MSPDFLRITPVLRIFDERKAREFYLDFLGFNLEWEHRFQEDSPLYMHISLGDIALHLSEHHGDACPGSRIFIHMHGVEEYHQKLTAQNYKYFRPEIEQAFYGAMSMEVTDPFGNRLSFNEFPRSKPDGESTIPPQP